MVIAADGPHAVEQALKARAAPDHGTAVAVIGHLDADDAVLESQVDVDERRVGVLGGVGHCLGNDVVGGRFSGLRQSRERRAGLMHRYRRVLAERVERRGEALVDQHARVSPRASSRSSCSAS